MSDAAERKGMPSTAIERTETYGLSASHMRVVALKVSGKRWSEIAAELGVTEPTIWRWRQAHPEIERAIDEESNDYLVSARRRFATLLDLGVQSMKEILHSPASEPKDKIAATKLLVDIFSQKPANNGQQPQSQAAGAGAITRGAGASASGTTVGSSVISDAELDGVLDAKLSEPDQREPTR